MKPLVINREIGSLGRAPELYVVEVTKWNESDNYILQRVYDNLDVAAVYALKLWEIERKTWLEDLLDYTHYNGTLGDPGADNFADRVFPTPPIGSNGTQFFGMTFPVLVDADLTDKHGEHLSQWNWDHDNRLTTGYKVKKLNWEVEGYWQ